ncbi:MAG: bifunctional (p)ppGpp synthetase/guanosine-3',5'-bis(diphosphate) 3'-pyrophosphohydrolase [Bacteroidetes bacterium]|nr:bifunctional (p)ppGpp synthetase/guanosine-3',5'-bis(diphosphate) 3'-pyrophosphohydrolase [Bacteroidota bacterium]
MSKVNEIYDLLQHHKSDENKALIQKAYIFAEKAHEGQKRASGEPYFNHVVEVAKNLARLGMDTQTIVAGLLHDTIEDTSVTEEDIKNEFGKDVLFLVNGVTKLGTLKYHGEVRHVESLRKFFVAMAEDARVIIIKLADRLHNVQTLNHLAPEKAKRIALETIEIHAPMANRLGMWRLKGELEDLAFPYAYPKEYSDVEKLIAGRTRTDEKYLDQVYKSLRKELAEHNINVLETSYRIKGTYSLYKKLKRKDMDIDRIYDLVALRVIVPTVEDCYKVLGIIHTLWRPIPGRIKDFIALPKPNGYKSLHTTIFTGNGGIAEIQIRTPEMHEQAEFGIASFFAYKEGLSKGQKNLSWIEQFKELQKNVASPTAFLENLKIDFFNKRIFVFTPKGAVIDLPEDSSIIDFAYAIHSDIGKHASGAKVNGKYSKLDTKLQNGDMVFIETNEKSNPSSKWLSAAKTTLARRHIKKYLDDNSLLNKFINRFK